MDESQLFKKKYLFFGGKGGVGKTTMAAATAIRAADMNIDTLVVSTDPAHSLSDSLDQQIGGDPIKVKGTKGLFALEVDSGKAVKEYEDLLTSQDTTGTMGELFGSGGMDFFDTTPPGADETIAFGKVLEFIENPDHDLVIFDTAPTGHTLRLLALPELMDTWLWKVISLRQKFSSLFGGIRRLFGGSSDDTDKAFKSMEVMREKVKSARIHLANPQETEFIAVTIPTMMAIWETERLIRALYEHEMFIGQIYVNQLAPDNPDCNFCSNRFQEHEVNLKKIYELYEGEFGLVEVPLLEKEIRGVPSLREFSTMLYGDLT